VAAAKQETGQRHFGVYRGVVTKLVDPRGLGRIQVRLPSLPGRVAGGIRAWATLVSPYAGDGQGLELLPDVGSDVVVAFEAGDVRRPYVVGACWSGTNALPERPRAANDKRLLRTRAGSKLEFDDRSGAERVTLSTQAGHEIVLDAGSGKVTITHAGGSRIVLNAAGRVEITAASVVEIAAAQLNVHAPSASFDGIVTCTTLIASSGVVSPSYTPGAGNIW
jgi:uncharacterized protein involved in type VI secretion and phage assembly